MAKKKSKEKTSSREKGHLPRLFFVSGMPRSGSTLLMQLLSQCDDHHITPTNGLCGLIQGVRTSYQQNEAFRAQGLYESMLPRVERVMRGMVEHFYENELKRRKIIFDKDRSWLGNIDIIEKILDRKIKILVTLRNPLEVAASWVKLRRKNPAGIPPALMQVNEHAMIQNLFGEGVVGLWTQLFRQATGTNQRDRIVVIPYDDLLNDPVGTLEAVHDTLEIPAFDGYDPTNVNTDTGEDDKVFGWKDLHVVKSKVTKPSKDDHYSEWLPKHTIEALSGGYKDIIDLYEEVVG